MQFIRSNLEGTNMEMIIDWNVGASPDIKRDTLERDYGIWTAAVIHNARSTK